MLVSLITDWAPATTLVTGVLAAVLFAYDLRPRKRSKHRNPGRAEWRFRRLAYQET